MGLVLKEEIRDLEIKVMAGKESDWAAQIACSYCIDG